MLHQANADRVAVLCPSCGRLISVPRSEDADRVRCACGAKVPPAPSASAGPRVLPTTRVDYDWCPDELSERHERP